MNTTALAEVAAVAVSPSQSPTPAQPSAAQVARFEQQLQAPAQFYQTPTTDAAGVSGNWRAMAEPLAQIDQQYRIDAAALDKHADDVSAASDPRWGGDGPSRTVELNVHELSMAAHMSNSMLSISLVASAEHLAEENVRTLYQQAG
jgi:hypothetical protein